MKDIQLNCKYLIIFRNCLDIQLIKVIARQTCLTHLPATYDNVTAQPFEPIIINMRPGTPDYLRVRSHVMPEQYM